MLAPRDVAIGVRGHCLPCGDRPVPDLNVTGGGAIHNNAPD